jgi:hypothetical protein
VRLLLAEQIAAAALAGRDLPAWFVTGAGRAVAVRISPKAPLAQEWKKDLAAAIERVGMAKNYFNGQSEPGAAAVVGGGFVGAIASGNRLRQFVELVDGGMPFDEAFAKIFKQQPFPAFEAWEAKAGSAGRGRGR